MRIKEGGLIAVLALALAGTSAILILNWYSYAYLKRAVVVRRAWDLNVCCGTTDGGGVNVDIVKHAEVPNFVHVEDVYRLPFSNGRFDTALCSHTVEHVEFPDTLDRELRRVARRVVYIVPPIWDLAAVFNVWEHRWIFLTCRKVHHRLPRRIPLPFARRIQGRIGQRVRA